jgi:hypothetical protein
MLSRLAITATVIIGVEGPAVSTTPPSRLQRLLVAPEAAESSRTWDALPALRQALEASGLQVQLVHRATGRLL